VAVQHVSSMKHKCEVLSAYKKGAVVYDDMYSEEVLGQIGRRYP
jgi:hypothetical protein